MQTFIFSRQEAMKSSYFFAQDQQNEHSKLCFRKKHPKTLINEKSTGVWGRKYPNSNVYKVNGLLLRAYSFTEI